MCLVSVCLTSYRNSLARALIRHNSGVNGTVKFFNQRRRRRVSEGIPKDGTGRLVCGGGQGVFDLDSSHVRMIFSHAGTLSWHFWRCDIPFDGVSPLQTSCG